MATCGLVGLFALLTLGGGDNLLANSGFEEILVDRPLRWDLYLKPRAGAVGRLSNTAKTGEFSVMLHVPTPYPRDPVNNWSQNIIGELGGQRLKASAEIKVEDAQEAALWVQCWRRTPWALLQTTSSSVDAPMYGTRDWEPVEMTLDVPPGTDFLTVRCVLLGTGTAWFDDLNVATAAEPGPPGEKTIKAEAKEEAPEKNVPATKTPPPAPPRLAALAAPIEAMRKELARMREANVFLAETLEGMQVLNKELAAEMAALRGNVASLQQEIAGKKQRAKKKKQPRKSAPTRVPRPKSPALTRPILTPHGEDWRKNR